jgi:hypothetical protein
VKIDYIYEYGAPLMGNAEASSSIMGRQRNGVRVATNIEIGELEGTLNCAMRTVSYILNTTDSDNGRKCVEYAS